MSITNAQIDITTFEEIRCPLCHRDNPERIYASSQECGPLLGKVSINLSLCQFCGFLFTNPRPPANIIKRYYEKESSTSGNTYYLTDPGSRFDTSNQRRKSFFLSNWMKKDSTAPARLLDIGCGAGHFLASLDPDQYDLYGLEPSEQAYHQASLKGLKVVNSGIENTPFENDYFDGVFCHSVLEHVHDLNGTLEAIRRILKPDGCLFIELPDSTRPEPQVGEFYSFEHLSHFTPATLSRFLIKKNFRMIALDTDEDSPRLRACATISTETKGLPALPDDRDRIKESLTVYQRQRDVLRKNVAARLDQWVAKWRENNLRVGIYGAGIHTQDLIALTSLGEVVTAIIDSDTRKAGSHYLAWTIRPPKDLDELDLDVVLISSKAFQDEIWHQLLPIQRRKGFEMVKLYA